MDATLVQHRGRVVGRLRDAAWRWEYWLASREPETLIAVALSLAMARVHYARYQRHQAELDWLAANAAVCELRERLIDHLGKGRDA